MRGRRNVGAQTANGERTTMRRTGRTRSARMRKARRVCDQLRRRGGEAARDGCGGTCGPVVGAAGGVGGRRRDGQPRRGTQAARRRERRHGAAEGSVRQRTRRRGRRHLSRARHASMLARRLRIWTATDGMVEGHFRLAPEVGGRFKAAIDAGTQRIFRARRTTGPHEPHEAYAADVSRRPRLFDDSGVRGGAAGRSGDRDERPRGHRPRVHWCADGSSGERV